MQLVNTLDLVLHNLTSYTHQEMWQLNSTANAIRSELYGIRKLGTSGVERWRDGIRKAIIGVAYGMFSHYPF